MRRQSPGANGAANAGDTPKCTVPPTVAQREVSRPDSSAAPVSDPAQVELFPAWSPPRRAGVRGWGNP